ncbi:YfgM family protein [Vulcaniibacterium gelatinicum]|uniref:YfgM family protein n=1 Tax=Vulcaniibacterium gelatinicum TaxID=2598725 RepID=UPI0011CA6B7D|nr:tetratricopeptide repeat protein [Vulcaniibacterium gelatinicum]
MAIEHPLDEHEQSERVRDWLRRNGAGIIGGVILGLALIGGWQWWQQERESRRLEEAERYDQAVRALEGTPDLAKAKAAVEALAPESVQAALARLQLAKAQVDAAKRDEAIATLRAIRTDNPALAAIVQVRLARLLVDAGKAEEALELLDAGAEMPAALEARGDAFAALGRKDEARKAYADALARLDVAAPQRQILELKLIEAGGTPARSEATP